MRKAPTRASPTHAADDQTRSGDESRNATAADASSSAEDALTADTRMVVVADADAVNVLSLR